MKSFISMATFVVSASLLFSLSEGHAYFSSITVDGVAYPEGRQSCVRPHPSSKYDYPLSDKNNINGIATNNMTCGWLPAANNAASRKCPVQPGSTVTIQWHYEMGSGDSDTFIIDPSHKGPCLVYMAKSDTGAGAVWFKIFEDGYDPATKTWCVTKLRENRGRLDVTIPTDITPGNYLFRSELIALHEGHVRGGAQPYVGCAEITVGGSGTKNPSGLVSIPGVYTIDDPGIAFNIYSSRISSYPIPGPRPYVSSATAPSSPPAVVTTGRTAPATTARATTGQAQAVTTGRTVVTTGTGRTPSAATTGRIVSDGGFAVSTGTVKGSTTHIPVVFVSSGTSPSTPNGANGNGGNPPTQADEDDDEASDVASSNILVPGIFILVGALAQAMF